MDIFIDNHQYHQINQANAEVEKTKNKVQRQDDELQKLRKQVDRMSLANQAMWELMRQTNGLSDEHILAKMEEIDLRDGSIDGKIGIQILDCPQCGRKTNSRRLTCVFCGTITQHSGDHVFE